MESMFQLHYDLIVLGLLFLAGLLAGFVDSIVGGGGLISVPAMLLTNLPPSVALGSNKLSGIFGSTSATINFIRKGKVDVVLVKKLIPLTFLGAISGAVLVVSIPPLYLKPLVIVLLIGVTAFVLLKKDWGEVSTYNGANKKILWLSGLAALSIGFYDGFIGPGTGTFLIFAFILVGFDFIFASGNAKVLNMASNWAALLVFLYLGQVNFAYGLISGLGQVIGAWIGSSLAIKKGTGLVRIVFLTTTGCMIGKLIYDYGKTLL